MMTISVVVPVYNSEKSLPMLIERLSPVLAGNARSYEVLLVNDGSTDQSWHVIETLATSNRQVRGINLMRNYGQHNALLCGMRESKYEVIVTIDDDLQNPPEEIPKLLKRLEEGYDVVYGTPEVEQHGFWRDMASTITKVALQGAMKAETARRVSAFRAFRSITRQAFDNYQGPFVSIDVLLTWATTRFTSVTVKHEARTVGVSHYTFRKLVTHALNMMTGFSVLPLQVASVIGFIFTLFGFCILLYVVGRYLIAGGACRVFRSLHRLFRYSRGLSCLPWESSVNTWRVCIFAPWTNQPIQYDPSPKRANKERVQWRQRCFADFLIGIQRSLDGVLEVW